MGQLLRTLRQAWRKIFGEHSKIEKKARHLYVKLARRSLKGGESKTETRIRSWSARTSLAIRNDYVARAATVFRNGNSDERVGIYMLGACDLPATFVAKPFIREHLDGLCAIVRAGEVFESRSDFLLELYESPPAPEYTAPVMRALSLPTQDFESKLFVPGFTVPYLESLGEFPKSAVIMSINGDATRTLYRHKEHGFSLDPGGWWLRQPMEDVLKNMKKVNYLKENFERVPRLTVDEFRKAFGEVVSLVKEHTGAEVLVFTAASLEPGSQEHNFGLVKHPQHLRRREMNVALYELSRELDFALVDVDAVLKQGGIREQVDYGHFPLARMEAIAREVTKALLDREVI